MALSDASREQLLQDTLRDMFPSYYNDQIDTYCAQFRLERSGNNIDSTRERARNGQIHIPKIQMQECPIIGQFEHKRYPVLFSNTPHGELSQVVRPKVFRVVRSILPRFEMVAIAEETEEDLIEKEAFEIKKSRRSTPITRDESFLRRFAYRCRVVWHNFRSLVFKRGNATYHLI